MPDVDFAELEKAAVKAAGEPELLQIHIYQVGDRVQQTAAWLKHCGLGRRRPFRGKILEWDKKNRFFMVQWDGIPGPSIARPAHIEPSRPSRWEILMEDADAVATGR